MKIILVFTTLLLSACTSSCAKKGALPEAPTAATTSIECYIANQTGVSCTGANLGAEVLALDLQGMFQITSTETVKTIAVTNQNWGAKATPLLLQSCISVSVYDSVTQTTTTRSSQCGTSVNTQTKRLENGP